MTPKKSKSESKNNMKKLSDTYKELGIAFTFPIEITDANGKVTYFEINTGYWVKREYDADGNQTYYESSAGYWHKYEYDANGNQTYFEDSDGYWHKREYDADGKETYYENSAGCWIEREYDADGKETYYENSAGDKEGTPRSAKTCDGKIVEVDGIKYELKAL